MKALCNLLLALTLAASTMATPVMAGDCHQPQPRCYWKSVFKHDYVRKPYHVTLTKYDRCGRAYYVCVEAWKTVKVPYVTRVKVCY